MSHDGFESVAKSSYKFEFTVKFLSKLICVLYLLQNFQAAMFSYI